jgi:dihydroflavonol-4-reductase
MTIVVTGATGHIGASLIRLLLSKKRKVRAIVRRNRVPLEGLNVELVQGDVRDPDSLKAAFQGATTVFHLGGVISLDGDPHGLVHAVNVVGTENVTKAAIGANVENMVHCSSIQAFHTHLDVGAPLSETCARPGHEEPAYDRSKWESEQVFLKTAGTHLKATIVNPTGVIGPADFSPSRMGQFFIDLAKRRLPVLIRGGADWVDVRDVAEGMVLAAERGGHGQNYILGGSFRALPDLADICSSITGAAPPLGAVPMGLAQMGLPFAALGQYLTGKDRAFTRESIRALTGPREISHQKATNELEYVPRALEITLQDTYAFFAQKGMLDSRHVPDSKRQSLLSRSISEQ